MKTIVIKCESSEIADKIMNHVFYNYDSDQVYDCFSTEKRINIY